MVSGIYISGEISKSTKLGASIFLSIIFSNPFPIEQIKNTDGIIPIKVAQKKLLTFTLNIHGNMFDIAKGIPPTNL